jgi:hypothetical protein
MDNLGLADVDEFFEMLHIPFDDSIRLELKQSLELFSLNKE